MARSTQTPVALAAILSLSVIWTVLAKRVAVRGRDDWSEPVNQYVVVAMASGERKSAVLSEMSGPLAHLERDLGRRSSAHKREAKDAKAIAERASQRATKSIDKTS